MHLLHNNKKRDDNMIIKECQNELQVDGYLNHVATFKDVNKTADL